MQDVRSLCNLRRYQRKNWDAEGKIKLYQLLGKIITLFNIHLLAGVAGGERIGASTRKKRALKSLLGGTLNLLHPPPQPAKCYCFLGHASSVLPVAQKIVVRLERQVATAYAYFCAPKVLQ